ncbi:unnamed protein product, partial [Ilex paraguariensis]
HWNRHMKHWEGILESKTFFSNSCPYTVTCTAHSATKSPRRYLTKRPDYYKSCSWRTQLMQN